MKVLSYCERLKSVGKDECFTAVTELSALHLLASVCLTKGTVPVNVGQCHEGEDGLYTEERMCAVVVSVVGRETAILSVFCQPSC